MKTSRRFPLLQGFLSLATLLVLMLTLFVAEADAQRRRSGGFGGGSFGGSRSAPSYAPSRPSSPSFGGSRPVSPAPSSRMSRSGSSFGGARPQSAIAGTNYRRSYGVPRQSSPVSVPGSSTPYMVHSYGGYTDGLMMGYLMGRTSMMWSMPFHPAFYYSRPVYVSSPDGRVEVYPPTFSFFRLFLGIAIIGGIVLLVVWLIRRRSSSGALGTSSQSSFS